MLQNPYADSSRSAQTRVDAFLDCVALLLARSWLRSQRQQEQQSSPGQPESPKAISDPQ